MFTRADIEQQQQRLSKVNLLRPMRFEPALEAVFLDYRYQRLLKRVPAIGVVGLILFTLFSILDSVFLPNDAARITISVRLLLICPLILCVILLAIKTVSARLFLYFYTFVYIFAGCTIVGIIFTADAYSYSLPYDGVLLHLVFGYFLMGLPYLMASYASIFVSLVYFFVSLYINLPPEQLSSNAIFILSLNFMGVIGGFIQDRARRFLFLNEQLVALAKAKDRKEIATKTRLVAIASHDLRQPLHAMNMLIEALQAQLIDPQQKSLAKSLNSSIKQLSQMLNTLLDISKLNAGIVQAKHETLNLAQKMSQLYKEFALRAKEAEMAILIDGPTDVYVKLDPVLFDRILRNILENIFVHADASEIRISWFTEGEKVCLSITDNGKGIAKTDIATIFDEFQQAGNTQHGMGLGLNIVKQLAELQNLYYELESDLGMGTTFRLNMPLAAALQTTNQASIPLAIYSAADQHSFPLQSSRFIEWGYAPVFLHPPSLNGDNYTPSLPTETRVLLWDLSGATSSTTNADVLAALDSLFDYLRKALSKAHQLAAILLVIDNEDQIDNYHQALEKGIKNLFNQTERVRAAHIKTEVVSTQVRLAKLRLVLTYLTNPIQ